MGMTSAEEAWAGLRGPGPRHGSRASRQAVGVEAIWRNSGSCKDVGKILEAVLKDTSTEKGTGSLT